MALRSRIFSRPAVFRRLLHTPSTIRTSEYPGVNTDLRDAPNILNDDGSSYPIGIPGALGSYTNPLPIKEVAMMMLMDKLTDKPNWHEKVFDEKIVQKWREEARTQSEDGLFKRIMQDKEWATIPKPKSRIISEKAFDFCISELRDKAKHFSKTGLTVTFDSAGHNIVKSDTFIESSLRDRLGQAFDELRRDQSSKPDWHPNSGEMVQDLVHPSMYPFVYDRSNFIQQEAVGVSNALDYIGQGETVPKNTDPDAYENLTRAEQFRYGSGSGMLHPGFFSNTYQWLPSNVEFDENGNARLTTYVNNLHPTKFPSIYKTIEQMIDKAIPAWDQCLQEFATGAKQPVSGRNDSRFNHMEIMDATDSRDDIWLPEFDVEALVKAKIPLSAGEVFELDEENWYSGDERKPMDHPDWKEDAKRVSEGLRPLHAQIPDESLARAKRDKVRDPKLPEPYDFWPVDYSVKKSLRERFKKEGLQVIVKMASVELTPEKPEFPAGGWHVEGLMNEKICATALYYLDCHNVTPSHLSFRLHTRYDFDYDTKVDQDEYHYLEQVYGTSFSGGSCLQTFGDVETRQGRLLAFPNVFQHCVSSFRLQDPTKPGHRRFIALWLVDPNRRIVSTANVPPQQNAWFTGTVNANEGGSRCEAPPSSLMSADEANEHRLKLMEERKARVTDRTLCHEEYSFCEH